MFNRKTFGKNVSYFRDKRNLTLDKCAEQIGISSDYLYRIEKGKHTPTVYNIKAILNCLDVTYTEMIVEDDEENPVVTFIISEIQKLDEREIELCSYIAKMIVEGNNKCQGTN